MNVYHDNDTVPLVYRYTAATVPGLTYANNV